MLIGVAVRTVRAVQQRVERSVVTFQPAVDVLPVCPVADGCLCDAVLELGIAYIGQFVLSCSCSEWGLTCLWLF